VLASLAPVVAVFEPTQRLHRHPADIEWITVVPIDKSRRDICWIERLLLNKAAGNTEGLFGIVCNRSCWLIPRPMANHLVELAVLGRN
jgi:hypothetical protein